MKTLVADIGGTNTRLIYADIHGKKKQVLAEHTYSSAQYADFIQLVNAFLTENSIHETINAACFAVAGPVKSGEASVTNLPWIMSEEQLSKALKIPRVKLINDFVAVAYGVAELEDADIIILQQGQAATKTDRVIKTDAAVIGAGTGLGASHLVWQNDHYQPYPSEAGHAGFSAQNELQSELLRWMLKQYTHVSVEMLLSGGGLKRIYQFLHEIKQLPETAAVQKAMTVTDPARVITDYALAEKDQLCQKTLDCFIDIYGAAASDIVLYYYPLTELYIAGGIAAKIKDKMIGKRFINAFTNKGPMSANMKEICVKLVCQEKVGLYGALAVVAQAF